MKDLKSKSYESFVWVGNRQLDSRFTFEINGGMINLILHSRGGAGKNRRNGDYAPAFELLLKRMATAGTLIREIAVQRALGETRPLEERKLLRQHERPINVALIHNIRSLRIKIGLDGKNIKDNPNTQGGNPTKRLVISLDNPTGYDFEDLLILFSGKG